MAIANGENDMDKNEVLKILETAKDKNGEVPMRLVRQAFEKLPGACEDTISRQAAIDAIRASTSKYTGFMEMEMYTDDDAVEAIEALPSAQPEIVRCKECKHRYTDECPMRYIEWVERDEYGEYELRDIVHDYTEDEKFCSEGERK